MSAGDVLAGMFRRTFLSLILAMLALFAVPTRPAIVARTSGHPEIRYWVVVDGKNPFVFGVKNDSELQGLRRARPTRYYDPVEARAACSMPS